MTRYLLPAPLLPAFGLYEFLPLTRTQARTWMAREDPYARITDAATATALERFLGVEPGSIPVHPGPAPLAPGDEALVFRPHPRLVGLLRRLVQDGGP